MAAAQIRIGTKGGKERKQSGKKKEAAAFKDMHLEHLHACGILHAT
jgi:hypothetical protein